MAEHDAVSSGQIAVLSSILKNNEALYRAIEDACRLGLDDYYFGAGCVAQTVWNHLVGNPPMTGISDIDFVYWDSSDLSAEAEAAVANRVTSALTPGIPLDVKNEARVHLWYKQHFGYDIRPYTSLEDAIDTWPTTAAAAGVRLEHSTTKVYAPFSRDMIDQ